MEFMFSPGRGHLSRKAARAAAKAGAILINYTEPGTGYKRHWFATRNLGEPFNTAVARQVMEAVRQAATAKDRELLG